MFQLLMVCAVVIGNMSKNIERNPEQYALFFSHRTMKEKLNDANGMETSPDSVLYISVIKNKLHC